MKYKLRLQENLVTKGSSPGRGFGSVLHKAREVWRQGLKDGKPHPIALQEAQTALDNEYKKVIGAGIGLDERRSLANAKLLFNGYTAKFSGQNYTPVHVEVPFKVNMGKSPAGNEVYRTGIIDEVCQFQGRQYVLDFKTSTPYPGGSWFDGWRTSDQFMGYLWVARQIYGETHGVIVHGVWVHTPAKTSRAKYKFEDYFTADIITFSDGQLEEWREKFLRAVDRREADKQSGEFDSNFGSACKAYGMTCDYFKWCSSDPKIRPQIESIYYDRIKWTPLDDERLTAEGAETA
jgi:hypothetical protein